MVIVSPLPRTGFGLWVATHSRRTQEDLEREASEVSATK